MTKNTWNDTLKKLIAESKNPSSKYSKKKQKKFEDSMSNKGWIWSFR